MLYFCSSLLFSLHYMMFLFLLCEGKTQLLSKNSTIKAVFAFGDSIVDQGNNNNITTIVKCNFPPYGKDFVDGKATGRFTNAKTPADLIGSSFHVYTIIIESILSSIQLLHYYTKVIRIISLIT